MPLTTLEPTAALVVIDLQKGIVSLPTAHDAGTVVRHSAALAEAFRAAGQPVVLVNVTGGAPGRTDQQQSGAPAPARADDWADLVDELGVQPGDHLVTKQTFGAFTGTSLEQYLRERGVTQVVLTGISTSIGVESTARFAHELGFHVVLVTDAMTDRSAESHDHSVTSIFPRLGETTTTQDVLDALASRA